MNIATWYFDFVSPFAYLQNLRLEEFSSHIKIDRKPLLFAGLLKHWASKGPAELPPKRLFTYRHVQWMADRLDIPLRFPDRHPFNPIPSRGQASNAHLECWLVEPVGTPKFKES